MALRTIDLPSPATLTAAAAALRGAAPGDRVLLVLPATPDDFASEVRLQVLRREADAGQVQVGLVTGDADVRQWARKARIPTFASADKAQGRWRYPKPASSLPSAVWLQPPGVARGWVVPPPYQVGRGLTGPSVVTVGGRTVLDGRTRKRKRHGWLVALGYLVMTVLLAALGAGLAVVLLPRATVTVTPARTRTVTSIAITAQTGIDAPDLTNKAVPARVVQARVEGSATAQATGSDFAPAAKATGLVTLINKTAREVRVPQGTTVRTTTGDNVRFRTTGELTVPAGIVQRATAPVEAVEPGRGGNVPASTINEVEGSLNLSLRVSNETPTGGGSVADITVVTQADKERARGQLQEELQRQAYSSLGESLRQGEYIPPETVETFTLAETYDRFAGEHADNVGLQLQLLARGTAIDLAGANSLADRTLRDSIPPDHFLLEDSVQLGKPTYNRFDEESVDLTLTASAETLVPIRTGDIRSLLAGATLADATGILARNFKLAGPPVITVAPDWLGRLPYIPTRIAVRVLRVQ
jgi:hypothetical protein